MQRNREPIYLGLVKWAVTCVNCPCSRPPPRHLSSCIFHLTVSSISVTRSGPKSTTTLKHFAFMRQMRHGQDTDQPSHSCPSPPHLLFGTPLPAPFCHGSIVINHFRAPRCRRMTHASGQHWVWVWVWASDTSQCDPWPAEAAAAGAINPAPIVPPLPQLVALFALFGGHKLFCCRWIQQIGKCSQVAAAMSHVPHQIPGPAIAHGLSLLSPSPSPSPSPCRFVAVRSHLIIKISNKSFGAAFFERGPPRSIIYIKIQIK